jgi:hypothetical protein
MHACTLAGKTSEARIGKDFAIAFTDAYRPLSISSLVLQRSIDAFEMGLHIFGDLTRS